MTRTRGTVDGEAAQAGTSVRPITVSLLLFAFHREHAGTARREIELPAGSSVADLLDLLETEGLPGTREAAVAVNRRYADAGTPLAGGDEVALVPPVSGG